VTFKPGYKASDKTRRKLSAASRGNKHSLGRVWSAESRAKLSAAMKGNKNSKGYCPTPEHRRKISEANKGIAKRPPGWNHTDETRAKIAAALEGVYRSPEAIENLRVAQRVIKLFRPEVHERKARVSSELMRANMQDPAYRERVAAGRKAWRERKQAEQAAQRPAKAIAAERYQRIADMRAGEMTLKEIAAVIGTTQQRVGQILQKIARRA
jgi:hypothetical protein